MAPPRKILRRQLEILVDYLEENRDISRGTPFSPVGHQAAKVKWNALAKKLNTVEGGAHKSPEGWKKYWFEWRHRCRKKAANVRQSQSNSANGSHKVSLNDVEVRALNINGKDIVDHVDSRPKKLQIFLSEDSDSEQPTKDIEQITSEDVKETTGSRKFITESTLRNSTPPPEWAIMLEDRRIAAEERIAKSLETIVTLMQLQEGRRAIIEEKIADTLVAITSNLKELHSENRKHLHCCKSNNEETESLPMKDVIFL